MRHYVVWLTDSVVIQTTTNNILHQISRLSGWHSCLVFQKFPNPRRNPWDITPTLQTSHNHFLPPTSQPRAWSSPSWDDINRLPTRNKSHRWRNPNTFYLVHNGVQLVHIQNHMNPAHISPPYLYKIYCNIIFPSMPTSSKRSLPFSCRQKFCTHLQAFFRATYPAYPINLIIL